MKKILILLTFFSLTTYADKHCTSPFNYTGFRFDQAKIIDKPLVKLELTDKAKAIQLTGSGFQKKYKTLAQDLKLQAQAENFTDLPLSRSKQFRPLSNDDLIARFKTLDPKIQKAIMVTYNTLNDEQYMRSYLKGLFQDSFIWMRENNAPELIKKNLENSTVTERSIAVTLIRRLKARKDTKFTKLIRRDIKTNKFIISGRHKIPSEEAENSNAAFRAAVRTGPFIDAAFGEFSGHGAYAHILQRDAIHPKLVEIFGEDVSEFYSFLGSKKGISFWADLFDADDIRRDTFNSPEIVTYFLRKYLID